MPAYRTKRRVGGRHLDAWFYQFQQNRKTYSRYGFPTKAEAEKEERKRRLSLERGEESVIRENKIQVRDLVDEFFSQRALTHAATSVKADRQRISGLLKWMGDIRLQDLTVEYLKNFRAERLRGGWSPRTCNLAFNLIRALIDHAIDRELLAFNAARQLKNLRETTKERWIPTSEELVRFLEGVTQFPSSAVVLPFMKLLMYTGLRPSEALHLEWPDIDMQAGTILIQPKQANPLKSGRFRRVPITRNLQEVLIHYRIYWEEAMRRRERRHEGWARHQWVFFNPERHAERALSFNKTLRLARDRARLPGISMYTFRHYFVSHAIMSGMQPLAVARITGHRNTRMIEEVYGHLKPDYLRAQMELYEAGIGGSMKLAG